jgi:hypothetical protein
MLRCYRCKRAAWRFSRERASVVSRWTWLQANISDLEYRIRQYSECHRQVRASKGAVRLEEPAHLKSLQGKPQSSKWGVDRRNTSNHCSEAINWLKHRKQELQHFLFCNLKPACYKRQSIFTPPPHICVLYGGCTEQSSERQQYQNIVGTMPRNLMILLPPACRFVLCIHHYSATMYWGHHINWKLIQKRWNPLHFILHTTGFHLTHWNLTCAGESSTVVNGCHSEAAPSPNVEEEASARTRPLDLTIFRKRKVVVPGVMLPKSGKR